MEWSTSKASGRLRVSGGLRGVVWVLYLGGGPHGVAEVEEEVRRDSTMNTRTVLALWFLRRGEIQPDQPTRSAAPAHVQSSAPLGLDALA